MSQLTEANERRSFDIPYSESSMSLYDIHAIGRTILDGDRCSWKYSQLFCTKCRGFVDNPFLFIALRLHLFERSYRFRLHVMVLGKQGVYIEVPIDDIDKIVEIADFVLRGILPQQILFDDSIVHERLVHREHI